MPASHEITVDRPAAWRARAGALVADRLTAAAVGAVTLGIVLRFMWPSDMEFKGDEQYVYAHAIRSAPSLLGDRASVGIPNPGLGQWLYWLMAHMMRFLAGGGPSPVGLDRGVMLLNGLALVGLLAFVFREISPSRREPWLYATALLALNPVAILFSRKLWIQCLLAPFALAALWSWWRRDTRRGAFAWGLVGLWLGQIHMTGLFFTAAFVVWTAVFDRRSVRWRWWLAGSVIGAATLVPWLVHLLSAVHASPAHNILHWDFWYFWLATPIGRPLLTSFGDNTGSLLALPRVGGVSLHLVGAAMTASLVAAVVIFAKALGSYLERRRPAEPIRPGRDTVLAVSAAILGYGILLTASGVYIYRHYITVAFVLPFLFLALAGVRAGRLGRSLLALIVVAQLVVSVGYLSYVHVHGGAPLGDYGYAYDWQARP